MNEIGDLTLQLLQENSKIPKCLQTRFHAFQILYYYIEIITSARVLLQVLVYYGFQPMQLSFVP